MNRNTQAVTPRNEKTAFLVDVTRQRSPGELRKNTRRPDDFCDIGGIDAGGPEQDAQ